MENNGGADLGEEVRLVGAIGEPKREIFVPTPDEAPRVPVPVREPDPEPPVPAPGVPVPAGT